VHRSTTSPPLCAFCGLPYPSKTASDPAERYPGNKRFMLILILFEPSVSRPFVPGNPLSPPSILMSLARLHNRRCVLEIQTCSNLRAVFSPPLPPSLPDSPYKRNPPPPIIQTPRQYPVKNSGTILPPFQTLIFRVFCPNRLGGDLFAARPKSLLDARLVFPMRSFHVVELAPDHRVRLKNSQDCPLLPPPPPTPPLILFTCAEIACSPPLDFEFFPPLAHQRFFLYSTAGCGVRTFRFVTF